MTPTEIIKHREDVNSLKDKMRERCIMQWEKNKHLLIIDMFSILELIETGRIIM